MVPRLIKSSTYLLVVVAAFGLGTALGQYHSHKDRPSVAYVVQGTMTEHRDGGATKEHPKGDAWSEGKETTHWSENKGKTPVVLVVGGIFKA